MPQPVNHGNNLRRQKLTRELGNTSINSRCWLTNEQKIRAKKHITRYRRNWDLFAEEVLQIKLYPLQKFSLHMMGVSQEYFELATRGAAKSWRVAIAAICAFCMFPYSEIVITSSTISQASKLVEKKIRDEIIKKLSPTLLYMYEHEYIVITKSNTSDGGSYLVENKLNGSTIVVAPCLESSRGLRTTINIYEEARLLKPSIVSSVFEPMGHARQAKFLLKPEYNNERWQEKPKSFYISSARMEYEWFTKKFRKTVENYYVQKKEKYVPFAQDIFTAIADGSRTWADYRKMKNTMTDADFHMEVLNESMGENEDAFFELRTFRENQILKKAFTPPTSGDIYIQKDLGNIVKEENEVRLIVADYAFANTTSAEKNDNTIIMCMSLHWRGNRFERHVNYVELWPASDSLGAGQRVRELYWLYEADYIVQDIRSGGESIFNSMTEFKLVPGLGDKYNPRGLTVSDKMNYHVISEGKYKDLVERTVDSQAIPCIIPFVGTADLNSYAWVELKKQLESSNIKFLESMQEKYDELTDSGEYFNLSSEQLSKVVAPYGQTDLLIQEAVNLKAEFKMDKVKLIEPRSGTKDRIVVLSYGNYIASLIENEWNKQLQATNDDWEDADFFW